MTDQSTFDTQATEQRYQLLVNAVSDYAIYMLDPTGRIMTWNAGARRFKGYEPEEIIGEHFSRFFTPEDRTAGAPEKALRIALEEGRYEAEGNRIRKDGSIIWVHAIVDPILGPDGDLVGYAKITRDVTERREADRALFAAEQRFRMLVQGVKDYAIYMLDLEGRVTNWNAGAQQIKGYAAAEIVGEHFSRFYTEEDRIRGEPGLALETALREGRYEREAERVRKDGSRFWAHVVIDPIRDESGTLIGFAKITRDITDRRRAQEELEQARAAIFQSQKMQALGELTGGIAHDFNNLMTVIRGSAELLQKEDLAPEKRRRYVRAITETADKATALTAKLLAFGRRQSLKPEVLDLGSRLDAFGEVLSRTLGSHIKVRLDLAVDLSPVEADAAELETALLNAAFNARDAMPDGGTLIISALNVSEEEAVRIALTDNGQGIPADILERVFDPFFTTKPVGKGTGLGLSQIHGFAAQTGGRAEIASDIGIGTTVSITLPATDRQPDGGSAVRTAIANWERLDVLLVEDNDNVRQFARSMLGELRAEVTDVESAEAALALLGQRHFDLVFSDIVMPGMSGLDLARHLRETAPGQRVLLATGYSREVAGGEAAGFHIVQKPYGAESLTVAISLALAD
ncbi:MULTISPECIES: PAS domain-containing sensor histidine kinase [unclassified Sphingomonas]|uniref:hybrid sensor histidine kinase/response regulator n=1 Tax=unclassified Sphingomonas TaxID=196159 RepID=UPI0006F6574E|nr:MULTISPECIES: PAS domain-containing sensor histidine kinase [unclassified Sphingomonas]KQX18034.1 PAS domain-containing sensor histidine kinase [Sphingomonas sp. Root1294]KQY70959.1 PAS domain-containing sensor histidine kinase [Sphingomonas sp. Root50]